MSDLFIKYPRPSSQFHGGQFYRNLPNFKCDFSVTTNIAGPPPSSVSVAKSTFKDIEHYPDQDAWDPVCHLAVFLGLHPKNIRLGNGASEFLDVVSRIFPSGSTWRTGPSDAAYSEIQRVCLNAGHVQVDKNEKKAKLTFFENPSVTDGHFVEIDELKKWIEEDSESTFIIDESFIFWIGKDWLKHSAISLIDQFVDRVIVISSWTKVLSCPGLRIGSVVSTPSIIEKIKSIQVPWSVNGFAQAFFIDALKQTSYLETMWNETPLMKKEMISLLKKINLSPNETSPLWIPYIFCECYTPEIADQIYQISKKNGLPIRACNDFNKLTTIRISVHNLEHFKELVSFLEKDEDLIKMINEYQKP